MKFFSLFFYHTENVSNVSFIRITRTGGLNTNHLNFSADVITRISINKDVRAVAFRLRNNFWCYLMRYKHYFPALSFFCSSLCVQLNICSISTICLKCSKIEWVLLALCVTHFSTLCGDISSQRYGRFTSLFFSIWLFSSLSVYLFLFLFQTGTMLYISDDGITNAQYKPLYVSIFFFGVNVLDANVSAVTILKMHVKNSTFSFVFLNLWRQITCIYIWRFACNSCKWNKI